MRLSAAGLDNSASTEIPAGQPKSGVRTWNVGATECRAKIPAPLLTRHVTWGQLQNALCLSFSICGTG
jgi:hypothetical protein